MKHKYIQPAVKQTALEEDLMIKISNTMGDEGQFINEGLFDDLDDELDDDLKAAETQARSSNISSLNVWER
jgi:hypothetical protein